MKVNSNTSKIRYYVREHETTKRFFNLRLLIIPVGYVLVMILLIPLELFFNMILGFLYILGIEWLIVYGMIVVEKMQTIINQQEKIMNLLENK